MTTVTDMRRRPQFTIGDRLRKARALADMDVREFSETLGVNRNTVTNYELEKTPAERMKPVVLKAWAMATGVDYQWLLTGGEAPAPEGNPATTHYKWKPRPIIHLHERLAA